MDLSTIALLGVMAAALLLVGLLTLLYPWLDD
jgi:hypothetical protein